MKLVNSLTSSFFFFLFITIPSFIFAQDNSVEMADVMRGNGKIYVVVAVVSVILLGLLIALISIDKKVKKLERNKAKE
jgi:hypothetical protein